MFNKITKSVFVFLAATVLANLVSCNTAKKTSCLVGPETTSIAVKEDAPDPSCKIQLDENFTLTVGMANECVATICFLAGYAEYQPDEYADFSLTETTKDYFDKYKNNKKVQKAIQYYKKLRRIQFSYDAPAQFATYITPDCHNWRTDYENVKAMCNHRNSQARYNTFGDVDKLLKVTADFYDETDFAGFYQSNIEIYNLMLRTVKSHSNSLKSIEKNYAEYFHQQMGKTVLNFSVFDANNNYGCHFSDGENTYYEPKYGASIINSFHENIGVIVHELCHPVSNAVAEKIALDPKIDAYLNTYLDENRRKILRDHAYEGNSVYMCELITRANTVRILSKFMDEDYVYNDCIVYDIQRGFDAVTEVAELVKDYEEGSYENFAKFEDRLRELYIEKICNSQ